MIPRLIEARERQIEGLLALLLRLLFGLWTRPGVVDDPLLVAATTAESVYRADIALSRARAIDNAFFQRVAAEAGVEYTAEERRTNPVYPRNADPVQVYGRYIEEFRWQMYGKPARDAARAAESALEDQDDLLDAPPPVRAAEDPDDTPFALLDPDDVLTDVRTPEEVDDGALIVDDEEEARRKDEAHRKAYDRLQAILQADVQRASGDEHRQLMERKPKTWTRYRRVIRPELSRTGTCGLCIAAASRTYRVSTLAAIHQNCRCTQLPITTDFDPGDDLNIEDIDGLYVQGPGENDKALAVEFTREQLQELYDAAGGTTAGAALKQVRVQYLTHGELGPVVRYDVERPTKTTPYREPSMETTREHWENTRVWAEAKKALVEAAIQRGETGPRTAPYAQALRQFDSLIARMEENLRARVR